LSIVLGAVGEPLGLSDGLELGLRLGTREGWLVGEEVGFLVLVFAVVFFDLRVLGRTSTVPMPFNKLENV
jgi:hypothetical protein